MLLHQKVGAQARPGLASGEHRSRPEDAKDTPPPSLKQGSPGTVRKLYIVANTQLAIIFDQSLA